MILRISIHEQLHFLLNLKRLNLSTARVISDEFGSKEQLNQQAARHWRED